VDLGLDGAVALVAGGGRGIGRAVAQALAREGADVAVAARTAAEVERVAAEVRAAGRRAVAHAADLAAPGAAARFVDAAAALGPPTLLVLCAAALYTPKKLHTVDDEEIASHLAVDLGAAIALCRAALPAMLAARHGRIVALGSLAARTGIPGATLYATAKAALEGLARGLAVDYTRRGITANVVAAGFTATERLAERLGGDPSAHERLVRATAARRLVTPEEVADVVVFLCSRRAAGVTGAVIDVTAGAHLNNLW
jgi:NAD(P)-dependent dehydrogenase (short-subunit alcohol dehydrogenase family)